MATTRKDVGAVTEPVTAPTGQPAEEKPIPFISEGVRQDLEIHGKAVDPATGAVLEMDRDSGEVTVTDRRTGKVTSL